MSTLRTGAPGRRSLGVSRLFWSAHAERRSRGPLASGLDWLVRRLPWRSAAAARPRAA